MYFSGDLYNEDQSILGSILGALNLGKPPSLVQLEECRSDPKVWFRPPILNPSCTFSLGLCACQGMFFMVPCCLLLHSIILSSDRVWRASRSLRFRFFFSVVSVGFIKANRPGICFRNLSFPAFTLLVFHLGLKYSASLSSKRL